MLTMGASPGCPPGVLTGITVAYGSYARVLNRALLHAALARMYIVFNTIVRVLPHKLV